MKRIVNGQEVELSPSGANISRHGDRLIVRTPEGVKTGLAVRQGDTVHVSFHGQTYVVEKVARSGKRGGAAATGELHAPMPGQIVDVLVEEGQPVLKGDKLVVLEAMKTQQAFVAPFDGTVEKVGVAKGEQVQNMQLLVRVAPEIVQA